MQNFWDYSVWGGIDLIAVLLMSLLVANILKRNIPALQASLIPTSVLGGAILILVSWIYKIAFKAELFDTPFFGGNGTAALEMITYHALALGFIASTFRPSQDKMTKKRSAEIFNTGITTVATYLMQGVLGLLISIIAVKFVPSFLAGAGVLLPFGYGQGTGQAMNYGNIFETEFGFVGGKSFGLTIAALGFLSASIGGVVHLTALKRKGKIASVKPKEVSLLSEQIQGENEIPMNESMDKLTVQIALIAAAYLLAYLLMFVLGTLLPGLKSVFYGFNFLLGVLAATLIKSLLKWLKKKGIMKREYTNAFLMARTSNFFFDVMVVAGIAAIRLDVLKNYWGIILIMGAVGLISTYFYNYFIARTLFPEYTEEQFLVMYGMLTGTASTGVILLREVDGEFSTPAADNLVYQNFPAIVFGFPMMILATIAPNKPWLVLLICLAYFIVLNVVLFRSVIFKKK